MTEHVSHGASDIRRVTDPPRQPLQPDPTRQRLSEREREVALLIGAGLKDAVIGRRLGLSPPTVRNYVQHIRRRLNLGSRDEIVAWVTARRTPGHPEADLHRGSDVATPARASRVPA